MKIGPDSLPELDFEQIKFYIENCISSILGECRFLCFKLEVARSQYTGKKNLAVSNKVPVPVSVLALALAKFILAAVILALAVPVFFLALALAGMTLALA